jgi:hypothetical protein
MYEVKQPHFVPGIPGSHCVCKHTITHCLGCGCCASFSFLFILFSGGDSISLSLSLPPPLSLSHTRARAHTHTYILFEGMVQDANTIPEELSVPLKAAYSFLFVQLLPLMCHVHLAWHKFHLCNVTNLSSSIQSAKTVLG